MNTRLSALFSAAALISASVATPLLAQDAPAASGTTTTLTLDFSAKGAAVSPVFYGMMTEEINHAYEGGLYAELIQNRTFKNNDRGPDHWSAVQDGGAVATISLDRSKPLNDALDTSLRLNVSQPGKRAGIANDGFWGIPVRPGTTYTARFFARAAKGTTGPLTASIESTKDGNTFASGTTGALTETWKQYTISLKTGNDSMVLAAGAVATAAARFVISTSGTGSIWFSNVSLFPPTVNNRPNGTRPDLMQKMGDLNPRFLRFPGGNFLEGDWFRGRFAWGQTLGPVETRPGHLGPWGYRSTDGMGLLEFLEWCEDLKVQPVLAVFAGYTLRGDHIEAGTALQGFVNDALDEIQYVTGDTSTKWGAQRAKDGHPKPFALSYVEVGNEDWLDHLNSYDNRFTPFYDAIRARYPKLKIIATAPTKARTPDILDDHYYRSPARMEGDTTHYDNYSRTTGPKIFVGEWATRTGAWDKHDGEPTPNMDYALSDAAWWTGLERNSDIVVMQCYAPLLVNVNPGARQWEPNLVGYDALASYGSPSYYAQKMFATNIGDHVVPITAENVPTQFLKAQIPDPHLDQNPPHIPSLFYVATRDSKTGNVYLKIVNTVGTPCDVNVDLKGAVKIAGDSLATVLAADNAQETNTLAEPTKLIPVTTKVDLAPKLTTTNSVGSGSTRVSTSFTRTIAPYSVNVLEFTVGIVTHAHGAELPRF